MFYLYVEDYYFRRIGNEEKDIHLKSHVSNLTSVVTWKNLK